MIPIRLMVPISALAVGVALVACGKPDDRVQAPVAGTAPTARPPTPAPAAPPTPPPVPPEESAMTAIVGKPAPVFRLKDQTGAERTLAEFKGKRVVLWFYPKANTGG